VIPEPASRVRRTVYNAASDLEIVRPMVEVVWAPMLAAFSVPLDKSDEQVVTYQCLEGFRHAVHVASVMQMETIRDAYITSLAKFTSLHSAADIKQKNIDAIKVGTPKAVPTSSIRAFARCLAETFVRGCSYCSSLASGLWQGSGPLPGKLRLQSGRR
jgi:hypothetical protein